MFATAYPASYEAGVEHLQSVQDEAAINALMEKLDAEQGNLEKQKLRNNAPDSVAADCGLQTAAVRSKQRSKEQGQATTVWTCRIVLSMYMPCVVSTFLQTPVSFAA